MKSITYNKKKVLHLILELIEKTPNDMVLGHSIRKLYMNLKDR